MIFLVLSLVLLLVLAAPVLSNHTSLGVVDKKVTLSQFLPEKMACSTINKLSFGGRYPLELEYEVTYDGFYYQLDYTFHAQKFNILDKAPRIDFTSDYGIETLKRLGGTDWQFTVYAVDWNEFRNYAIAFNVTYEDHTSFVYSWNCTDIPNCMDIALPTAPPIC